MISCLDDSPELLISVLWDKSANRVPKVIGATGDAGAGSGLGYVVY